MLRKIFKKFGFLILAVVIAVCGYIYICAVGKEYVYVNKDFSSGVTVTDVSVDADSTGKVDITKWEMTDRGLMVHLKSAAPGKVYLSTTNSNGQSIFVFYVHDNGVITYNNFFGDCTGSDKVILSLIIYLVILVVYFTVRYFKLELRNFYSYDNVLYLSLIIFAFFLISTQIEALVLKNGINGAFAQAMTSFQAFVIFTLPIVVITTACVTVSNIKLIRKEGRTWRNMLGVILGLMLGIGAVLPIIIGLVMQAMPPEVVDIHIERSIVRYVEMTVNNSIYAIVAYLECILLGTIITGIKTARHIPKFDKEYIIINGCQIRKDGTPTPLLQARVDRAIEFAKMQQDRAGKPIIFVPSGGKGSDETLSEAESMKRYLISQGISEKNILAETRSATTEENFVFSYDLIRKRHGSDFFKVAFSTTNYHVFRSGMLASQHGIRVEGIGSKTKSYFWINAFVREYIATIAANWKTQAIVVTLLILINLIGSLLMYISEVILF